MEAAGERERADGAAARPGEGTAARARALHDRALVWDAHMDTLQRVLVRGDDLGERMGEQTDLPSWREGGFGAQVFAVWIDGIYARRHAARRALQLIDAFHAQLARHADRMALARTAGDVRRITGEGRLAALLSIEGGLAIEEDLGVLRSYHRLGATCMTLTHAGSISWADASTDAPRSGGLSAFGRQVIEEMNRLGMVVNVSHTSDATVRAVLETSRAPIIASHSCCRALCEHPRNLTDELMRAIADHGGVIGINFFSGFLDQDFQRAMFESHGDVLAVMKEPVDVAPEALDALAGERMAGFFHGTPPRPPFERILEHIEHAVRVVGADHVGLGSDLDSPMLPTPAGMDGVADYPKITEGLLRRGMREADVEKVLGGCWLRVWGEVVGA